MTAIAWIVAGFALALAAWAAVVSMRERPVPRPLLLSCFGLQALVFGQLVVGLLLLGGDAKPAETATFLGYLFGSLLVVPAGIYLALDEPSRWSPAVLGVALFVLAILCARLVQLAGVHA